MDYINSFVIVHPHTYALEDMQDKNLKNTFDAKILKKN